MPSSAASDVYKRQQYEYTRFMIDKLGFVYGPYNNFTDFAPVNEYWDIDHVSRTPDNQLQRAWARCYAPKPAWAVEMCERLAPIIQDKFHFNTAYCDVHTAVTPWGRVDYDYRVPGAGTFTAVFYSFGEIMLLQKKAWGGPVYSEGNHHFMYCGLTDGNYAQDQDYRIADNPWLVDFDLRRLHDLCCNFGMGNPGMFYVRKGPEEYGGIDAYVDRFLAATVAFGHPGFLVMTGGFDKALRSYYMIQQLASRYTQASVEDIRYVDERGRLLDTTMAVATGAYKRSQVVVRYTNGCVVAANGNKTERMKVEAFGRKLDLPPNGYAGWSENGEVDVLSADTDGHRFDYAATPAYNGTLTLGENSTLQLGWTTRHDEDANALGSQGITMHNGSQLRLRLPYTVNLPPVNLAGDASIHLSPSTSAHWRTRNFDNAISGPGILTLIGNNGNTANLNATNTFSGLVANADDRWVLAANAPGSLGTGDVTINPRAADDLSLIHI